MALDVSKLTTTRQPASDERGKPLSKLTAPQMADLLWVEDKTVDFREELPAFGSAHPDDPTMLLVQIQPVKGQANLRNWRLGWLRNLTREQQEEYGYSISYGAGETVPRVTWRFRVLASEWSPDGWSETCPVPGATGALLAGQTITRGNEVYATVTLTYKGLAALSVQALSNYTISYPYPDKLYYQVTWRFEALKTDATTRLAFGTAWGATLPVGHEFYDDRASLLLIKQGESNQRGSVYKTVTYVFRKVPSMATQATWNSTFQRLIRPAVVVRSRSYDVIPGSGDDATAALTGLNISDQVYPTDTWLRRRVLRACVDVPDSWTEQNGLWYRYPALFATRKREKRRYFLATTTYTYATTEPTPDAPTSFSGNIADLLYKIAGEVQDVMMDPASTEEEKRIAQGIMSTARLQLGPWTIENCVHAGITYTVTGPVMSGSVAVSASTPSSVPGTIIVSDRVRPWRGGIYVRARTTIPG